MASSSRRGGPPSADRGATSSRPPRGRNALLLLAAVAAVLLMALWLGPPRGGGPDTDSRPTSTAGQRAPGSGSAAERSTPALPPPPRAPARQLPGSDAPVPPGLAPNSRMMPELPPGPPPYPPDTFALAEELHPGTTEPTDGPGSKDGHWRLRFHQTPYVVRAPAPIVVTLELLDPKGQRSDIPRAELSLKTANPNRANPPVYQTPFVDDGSGADTRGDLVYTATWVPPQEARPGLFGHVLMQIQAALPDGSVQVLSGTLEYSPEPRARLTGRYSDSVRDGHLFIDADVHVDAAGLYRLTGQLFGPQGEPIAESYALQTLQPGDTRVSLRFFGKVLVDKGVDGPYRLRDVYLSEEIVEEAYAAMGPLVDEAHVTRPYKVSQFSPEPYQAPEPTGPQIGPDHPSQRDKPPPLLQRQDRDKSSQGSQAPPADAPPTNAAGPK